MDLKTRRTATKTGWKA